MAEPRRLPGMAGLLGLLLLVGPLGVTAWWLTRPVPDGPPPGPALDELDVVCTGRVDAEGLVVALDPNIPGRRCFRAASAKRARSFRERGDATTRRALACACVIAESAYGDVDTVYLGTFDKAIVLDAIRGAERKNLLVL